MQTVEQTREVQGKYWSELSKKGVLTRVEISGVLDEEHYEIIIERINTNAADRVRDRTVIWCEGRSCLSVEYELFRCERKVKSYRAEINYDKEILPPLSDLIKEIEWARAGNVARRLNGLISYHLGIKEEL